jgi:hypothetical protein
MCKKENTLQLHLETTPETLQDSQNAGIPYASY